MSNNPPPVAMKPATPQNLTPKLRFPEFRENEGWSNSTIGHFLTESRIPSKKNDPRKRITVKLNLAGIERRKFRGTESIESTNHFVRKSGQFIYGKQNIHKGAFGIIPPDLNDFETSQDLPAFTFAKDCDPGWFFFYLSREHIHSSFEARMSGTGSKRLNEKIFLKEKISIPALKEQSKIADCLTSLDELIAAESQQLEALKAHKKGLMQQLFPREGETTPRRRFSAFQNTGEWNSSQMGMRYSFERNNSLSREQLNHEGGSVKNIHYGDIHTKYPALFDITKETVPYITSPEFIKKIKPDNFCVEGDLIFADASEDLDDVGKCIEIVELDKQKLVSGLHTILARPNSKNLMVGFGGYLFQSENIRKQIQKESQGAKVFGISAKRLSLIQISFPNKKTEQEKIVRCLSALDKVILKRAKEVIKLKDHKKGLMQQLFPSRENA